MSFTDSPTERTTAITDVMVFLVALVAIGCMGVSPDADPDKILIWIVAFGFIAVASLLGAIAHGIVFSENTNGHIWHVLNLSLGLAVSMFVVGVVYDLAGAVKAHRMLPMMVSAGVLFFFITRRFPGIFVIFIIYEAVALLFALGAYGWLAFAVKSPGAGWMTAGVLTSLIAAVVQAIHRIRVVVIWPFDHNGLFHVIQCAGLLLLLRGILS
jgi:hypothetical protein